MAHLWIKNAQQGVHTHDCDCCAYKGTFVCDRGEARDVYLCGVSERTLVVRKSSEGPDYKSHPLRMAELVAEHDREIKTALERV